MGRKSKKKVRETFSKNAWEKIFFKIYSSISIRQKREEKGLRNLEGKVFNKTDSRNIYLFICSVSEDDLRTETLNRAMCCLRGWWGKGGRGLTQEQAIHRSKVLELAGGPCSH